MQENDIIFEGNKEVRNSTKTQMTITKMCNIVYESESYLIKIIWGWLKLRNTLLNSHLRKLSCNEHRNGNVEFVYDSSEHWEGILKLCM